MATQSLAHYRPGGLDLFRGGDPFRSLHRQIDRMFDDVWRDFGDTRGELAGVLAPNIDVVEHDKETRITAELPGVREEDLDLSVDGDMVTIRAEKKIERQEDGDRRHVSERAYGTFARSLRLPYPVDADAVKAHFDRGVLTITLPRNAEAERRRRIAIESGPAPAAEARSASEARH